MASRVSYSRLLCLCLLCCAVCARSRRTGRAAGTLIVADSPAMKYDECLRKHNVTADATPERGTERAYRVLESCLYYELSEQADRAAHRYNSLRHEAPLRSAGDADEKIAVAIISGVVTELTDPDGDLREMTMQQEFNLEWIDYRLEWDNREWGTDYIDIENRFHVWTPDIEPPMYRIESTSWFEDIRVFYNGRVTAKYQIFVKPKCDIDFENFPSDKHRCCYELRNKEYARRVVFDRIEQMVGDVSKSYAGGVWRVQHFYLVTKGMLPALGRHAVDVCIVATRSAGTLDVELGLPVLAVVAVVVSAPLFGDMRTQCFVKMFGLGVQMLALQFLGQATPREAFAGHTPKLYRFYEFSMMATVASLMMTVALMAIARQPRKLPPSHSVYLIAAAVNLHLCCTKPRAHRSPSTYERQRDEDGSNGRPPPPPVDVDYTSDWAEILAAVNNIASVCFLSAYFLGTVILHF